MDRDALDMALDALHASGPGKVMSQFVMLGAAERRRGGQGTVQFARLVHSDRPVAIKFFFSRKAFEVCLLYTSPSPRD